MTIEEAKKILDKAGYKYIKIVDEDVVAGGEGGLMDMAPENVIGTMALPNGQWKVKKWTKSNGIKKRKNRKK